MGYEFLLAIHEDFQIGNDGCFEVLNSRRFESFHLRSNCLRASFKLLLLRLHPTLKLREREHFRTRKIFEFARSFSKFSVSVFQFTSVTLPKILWSSHIESSTSTQFVLRYLPSRFSLRLSAVCRFCPAAGTWSLPLVPFEATQPCCANSCKSSRAERTRPEVMKIERRVESPTLSRSVRRTQSNLHNSKFSYFVSFVP